MRWVVVYAKSLANDRKYRRPIRWKISSDDGGRAFAMLLMLPDCESTLLRRTRIFSTACGQPLTSYCTARREEEEEEKPRSANSNDWILTLSLSLSIVKSNFYSYRYQATSTVSKLPSIRARLVRITEILEGRRLPAFEDRRGGELGVIEYRSFENSALPGKFTWKHNL